jgi:hypothetical protein
MTKKPKAKTKPSKKPTPKRGELSDQDIERAAGGALEAYILVSGIKQGPLPK